MSERFLELPDLANETVGGVAIACNDEFFAAKENLLRPHPAEWKDHLYTDRGKWMDGWETRRRREPGHDWCVIRLGLPGKIRGVVVDTAFFRGNFPESCAIAACEIDDPLDVRALEHAEWTTILPQTKLAGDTANTFAIDSDKRFTHVRLEIYPDGGVARLRVHGEVVPSWKRLGAHGGLVDLAALEHGAVVETCSDMFFGSRNNLIKPGPSRSMADGWETRRRRGPGNDWAIVRLGAGGTIEVLEVDTTHFKGNAPGRCTVEGVWSPGTPASDLTDWRMLLASPLQPHTRHRFDGELRRIGAVTHLRLSVFPDGGVARLRAYGTLSQDPHPGLVRLNTMPPLEATAALLRCCGSATFVEKMTGARPFEDVAALHRAAERIWWSLNERDYLEAFAAHPKIGESSPSPSEWSHTEQAAATGAASQTIVALGEVNRQYLDQYGFIYIVCATGRSADAMLADLRTRLGHSRAVELRTAAEEQAKITRLRLGKLLGELA